MGDLAHQVTGGQAELCATGIEDLDDLLNGGIPRGNVVLVSGPPGTGKTTLCLEYVSRGAAMEENAAFISVTEPVDRLLTFARGYAFFDEQEVEKGTLNFFDLRLIADRLGLPDDQYDLEDTQALLSVIESIVKEYEIERLIIDSITALCYHLGSPHRIRDFMYQLGETLSALGCTTFLTSELNGGPGGERSGSRAYSTYGVEESIADGIIAMDDLERSGDLLRTMQVVKMRGVKHSRTRQVIQLDSKGMRLTPLLAFRSGSFQGGGGGG